MNRKCPVCGSSQHEKIRRIEMMLQEGIPLPGAYHVVACRQCGCCFANTAATQSDYDFYYSKYNHYSGQDANKTFLTTFSSIKGFIEAHLPKSAHILDIGFGKGEILLHLQELGYTGLAGLDPSQSSVDQLRKSGIPAYCKSVYDMPDRLQGQYDLVCLTSVAEHLLDPKTAVIQSSAYLKENGYMIVDIPDYAKCDKIRFPIPNQFNQEHINYFSRDSFLNMLNGTELRMLEAKSIELKFPGSSCSEYSVMFLLQKHHSRACCDVKPDLTTKKAIENYFLKQDVEKQKTIEQISGLYKKQTPLVIWGTGAFTMSLLASSDLLKCNIAAFVDGNPLKKGTSINGRIVVSPEEIRKYPEALIAVCAMRYADEIKHMISELGLPNKVIEFGGAICTA